MPTYDGPGAGRGAEAGDGARGDSSLDTTSIGSGPPVARIASTTTRVGPAPSAIVLPAAHARAMVPASEMPPVSEADALSDGAWFGGHPERVFRARRGAEGEVWIVRRAGDVLLRAIIRDSLPTPTRDSDGELGPAWFLAAWPSFSVGKAQRQGRRAARRGKRGRG
jgi:hypothetical protein